jgi:hypothetical protein
MTDIKHNCKSHLAFALWHVVLQDLYMLCSSSLFFFLESGSRCVVKAGFKLEILLFIYLFIYFSFYSYVHTMFGSFLPPSPSPLPYLPHPFSLPPCLFKNLLFTFNNYMSPVPFAQQFLLFVLFVSQRWPGTL